MVIKREFEITLAVRKFQKENNKAEIVSIDTVKSDDLAKCLAQFALALAIVTRKITEDEIDEIRKHTGYEDDDIPF